MYWFAFGVALLVALAIIVIGAMYLAIPHGATRSFGLPLPGDTPNIHWWLRLKGVRDIVSGLLLLFLIGSSLPGLLGKALAILALIPLGDMSMILAARGSTPRAFGIHGVTAALMLVAAFPLIAGAA